MGTGWRRAFCTSISRDPTTTTASRFNEQQQSTADSSPSPRSCGKLSFFSRTNVGAGGGGGGDGVCNSSTPRLASEPSLRCRTKKCKSFPDSKTSSLSVAAASAAARTPTSGSNNTPKWSPSLFQRRAFSNPSSPRSPSKFTLFKHFYRNRCRVCSQSLRTSQEIPVFTAECSHVFHFPCIAAHVRSHGTLVCPVCSANWQQAPFLSAIQKHQPTQFSIEHHHHSSAANAVAAEAENRSPNKRISSGGAGRRNGNIGKAYDDDEPLVAFCNAGLGGAMRFNPIPEEDRDDEEGFGEDECHSFLANDPSRPRPGSRSAWPGNIEVKVMPESVLVSAGRRHQNYVVAIKVKAPPLRSAPLLDPSSRAPIDLVTVLDVSQGMTGEKLQMLKRAMRMLISSLGAADRLSVVAFSSVAGAKRLLPLRRMSRHGQRSARQVVERLVVVSNGVSGNGKEGQCASVGDALRKATKVLEDRRERNPVATIMLLSDTGQQQQRQEEEEGVNQGTNKDSHNVNSQSTGHNAAATGHNAAATRFAHLEIPMDAALESGAKTAVPPKESNRSEVEAEPYQDAFSKCVGGLLSVVMQDVRLEFVFPTGEIASVYSSGRADGSIGPMALGVGANSVRLGDLYAEEERELLVELRVPTANNNQLHHLAVKCSYRDPATQELVLCGEQPLLLPPFSTTLSSRSSLRLRNLFVWTRAMTESRRLVDLSDYATAHHLLCSARSLLLQSIAGTGRSESADNEHNQQLIRSIETELSELQLRRQLLQQRTQQQHEDLLSPTLHRRTGRREQTVAVTTTATAAGTADPLTPTSAWRAAEQLAKVAIMRKSLNRVSDLHGFENARF